jgi:hypothetical protein
MLSFMGASPMERWTVPQVAVIDRNGMIRAQTQVKGDPNLQDESYLRRLINLLLSDKGTR